MRKDYKIQKLNHQITNNLLNFSGRRIHYPTVISPTICTTTTSIMPTTSITNSTNSRKLLYNVESNLGNDKRERSRTSSSSQNDSPPPSTPVLKNFTNSKSVNQEHSPKDV